MSAPVVVSKGTAAAVASGTTVSPTRPGSIGAGDIELLFVNSYTGGGSNNTTFTDPVGWTRITATAYVNQFFANNGMMGLWWRRAAGGETGTVSVVRGGTTTNVFQGQLFLLSGCAASGNPFDAFTVFTGSGGAAITYSSVAAAGIERTLLALAVTIANAAIALPAGYTTMVRDGTALGATSSLEAFYLANVAAGSYSASSASGGAVNGSGSIHLAFAPLAAAGAVYIPVSIPNRNVGPMALRQRFRRAMYLSSPRVATQQSVSVDGAVTPAGALTKQAQKPLGGGATPTGAIANQTQKPLTGALTSAGALIKQAAKILTGAAAPAGSLSKQTQKPLAGGTTPSGGLVKLVSKFLSGTLSSAGSLVLTGVKLLSVSGGITPAGSLVKQTSKLLTGNVSPTGALKRATAKLAGGNITPSGSLIKQIAKNIAGTLTSAGTAVIRGVKLLVLGGGITPAGTLAKQDQKPLAGSVTPAGTLRKSVAQRLTGILTPAGSLARQARKTLTGALTSVGSLLTQFGSIAAAFITTRTRTRGPGSSLTRRAGGDGLTRSDPVDGLTSSEPGSGLTRADGDDGDTRSDLGGS